MTPTTHPKRRSSPLAWIQSHIEPVQLIQRTKEYQVLGRLSFVSLEKPDGTKSVIDFRRAGPFVAKATASNLVLIISEWTGIPPHLEPSAEQCPECGAPCPFCKGAGLKMCTLRYCGGVGKRVDPQKLMDFSDETCCPACLGTGKVKCDGCQGTGFYSTGIIDGALYDADARPAQPKCASCQGRRTRSQETAVNLEDFAIARVDNFVLVGEIARFTVAPQSGRVLYQYEVLPDPYGDRTFLVIDQPHHAAFLLGGITACKDVGAQ